MKFAGLAAADAYSGPELRCLFPDLALPIVGYAMTSEWTAGETGGVNVDSLAWLDHMEASPGPKIAVLADVGSQPGRGGIVGDGMMAEYRAFGCVGAVVGGSVMDLIPMARWGSPCGPAAWFRPTTSCGSRDSGGRVDRSAGRRERGHPDGRPGRRDPDSPG